MFSPVELINNLGLDDGTISKLIVNGQRVGPTGQLADIKF